MKGISEFEFLDYSNALNDRIGKYQELIEKNADSQELDKALMNIDFFVSELIDKSQGRIETNNVETRALFNKIFELSCGLKRFSYNISHARKLIKSAKSDSELDKAAEHLYINNSFYKKYLQETYNLTNEMGSKKTMNGK